MKKSDWLILIILILSPIFINYAILGVCLDADVNGSLDGWLGFYGTLVGSLVTMFVLYRTRVWNQDDNNETRERQNKILKYQEKRIWYQELRKQLDENFKVLKFHETISVANEIAIGKYVDSFKYLTSLIHEVELQSHKCDTYFIKEQLTPVEKKYNDIYGEILKFYITYLYDLSLICIIKSSNTIDEINKYITQTLDDVEKKLNELQEDGVNLDFMKKLKEIIDLEEEPITKICDLCALRIMEISNIQAMKLKLIKVTKELLIDEQKEIEKLFN